MKSKKKNIKETTSPAAGQSSAPAEQVSQQSSEPRILNEGYWFRLLENKTFLVIEPSLAGLIWLLTHHYGLSPHHRIHEEFDLLLREFLKLQFCYCFTDKQKREQNIITANLVTETDRGIYVLGGDINNRHPLQCLSRDWYLECNKIKSFNEEEIET